MENFRATCIYFFNYCWGDVLRWLLTENVPGEFPYAAGMFLPNGPRRPSIRSRSTAKTRPTLPALLAVIRSTEEERRYQVESCRAFQERNKEAAEVALVQLQQAALSGGNVFESLMEAAKVCSLGQLSNALYAVGGQYRRNM